MKRFFLSVILLLFTLIIYTACSDNNNDSEDKISNEDKEMNDSLAKIIKPVELSRGRLIYKNNCQTCHQKDGLGVEGAFPSIAEKESEANTIVNGKEGTTMIAFKDELNEQEIIDVINFINNSWGKRFGRITLEEIKDLK